MIRRSMLALGLSVLPVAPATAVQCVNPGGSGGCFATIQAAVDAAASGEQIDVAAGTYAENVQIPGGPTSAPISLSLVGAGAGVSIVDGGGAGAVVTVRESATVSLFGLTLTNGAVGLRALTSSTATLTASEVFGNIGEGGIDAGGRRMTLLTTTVMGNSTAANGGGINVHSGRAFVTESVVSQNTAARGAGLYAARGVVTIERSTVSDNDASDSGGGIFGEMRARVAVSDSTIVANTCGDAGGGMLGRIEASGTTIADNVGERGGGVFVGGTMKLTNCTISGNQAASGGGVHHPGSGGRIVLASTTVAENSAVFGGGIALGVGRAARVLARNTIIANNTATFVPAEPDCSARVRSRGYNLIENTTGCEVLGTTEGNVTGMDPVLGPLANNGGPTDTHALLVGSPAIDAGNPAEPKGIGTRCPVTDQRGVARTDRCDIGAYESP